MAASVLVALALPQFAVALSYSYTAPSECDPMTIAWEDGEPPFTLMLNTAYASPTITTLDASTWNGKKGKYTIDHLPLAAQKEFIVTLYDKRGFLSGAVSSPALKVGSSIQNAKCDVKPNAADFTFAVDDALRQCSLYSFYGFSGATLPVTLYAIIAGGTVDAPPKQGTAPDRFPVLVDIAPQTRLVYWMVDARNRSGGLTDMLSVITTGDSSCITSDSPHVTPETSPQQVSPDANALSAGAIAAAVIGTLIAFLAIGAFIFIRKRRSRSGNVGVAVVEPYVPGHSRQTSWFSRRHQSVDLLGASREGYRPTAVTAPVTPGRGPTYGYATSSSGGDETGRAREGDFDSTDPSFIPDPYTGAHTPHTMSSFQSQQATQPGQPSARRSSTSKGPIRTPHTPRFILHTDAGTLDGHDEDKDEVVELPPMYVDTRSKAGQSSTAAAGRSEKPRFVAPPAQHSAGDDRHLSYASAMTMPRGPRTERTVSFGGASSVATGYDDPVLDRSVSQYAASPPPSPRLRNISANSSQPLRAHNGDLSEDEDGHGSNHPQYDVVNDPAYSADHHSDRDTDVQLAYVSPHAAGPAHPLANSSSQRSQPPPAQPSVSRQNTATQHQQYSR